MCYNTHTQLMYAFHCALWLVFVNKCYGILPPEICPGQIVREFGKPRVSTAAGLLEGRYIETNAHVKGLKFFGIPIAQEPVGKLRFAKPIERKPWKGIYQAISHGLACPQNSSSYPSEPVSEDCIWLSIHAPANSLTRKDPYPVLYYVYGGGWEFGAPGHYEAAQIFQNFVAHGVIFVIGSYRVGALGFWSTGTKEAAGNWGLHDIMFGLSWVQKEIRNFGGDPNRVTLTGHSSAGFGVSLLSLSPLTAGLYHQLIILSGSAFNEVSTKQDLSQFQRTVQATNCDSDNNWGRGNFSPIIECLRKVPAMKLTNAYLSVKDTTFDIMAVVMGPTTWPRVDGPEGVLPSAVENLARMRRPVRLLTGSTFNEEALAKRSDPQPNADVLLKLCGYISQKFGNTSDIVKDACFYHYNTELRENSKATFFHQPLKDLVSDYAFATSALTDARNMRSRDGTVYLYSYDYVTPSYIDTEPHHATDVYNIMGMFCSCSTSTQEDVKIRNIYSKLLATFVIYGKPTLDNTWEPLKTEPSANYYSISLQPKMKEFYHFDAFQFWKQIVPYLKCTISD